MLNEQRSERERSLTKFFVVLGHVLKSLTQTTKKAE